MNSSHAVFPFRRNFCFGALFALALIAATSVFADESTNNAALHFHATSAGVAPMNSVFSSFPSGLELRALKDDSNVSLRLGSPSADKHRFIALTATAPIGEGDTTLATLDGLSKAVKLEFKVNWYKGAGPVETLMRAMTRSRSPSASPGQPAQSDSPEPETARQTNLKNRLISLRSAMVAKGPVTATELDEAKVQAKQTTLISASATAGYQTFDYLEGALLEEQSTSKKVYSGRVSWGKYVWDETAFALDFEYQGAYEAAEEKSFALPANSDGMQEVRTGAYGPPTRSTKRLYSAEIRKRLNFSPTKKGSIALKVTYNQVDDVLGFRVPLYFIENAAADSSGGIELGWIDQKDPKKPKFTVGVVIGAGLKFTPF